MAILRSPALILTTFTLTALFLFYTSSPVIGLVGGRTEIKDVKSNEEIQDLGKFSVEEYNRQRHLRRSGDNGAVMFKEVVEAQKQVVSGIKYYLKIEAKQNGGIRMFDSVVVVKPWVHQSKQLLNFAPSND